MIEFRNVTKSFGGYPSLQDVTATIQKGSIFGLIGSNGAGKSTLLRCLAGIYRPDQGSVLVEESPVYENEVIKQKIFYISDDQFYFANSNMKEMAEYYSKIYLNFSMDRFYQLTDLFQLDPKRKLATFSKGMQKQAHIIMAIAARPDYLLCDETFDGLDPVMRLAVKRILADEVLDRGMTVIIASHNLRELEDICDHIGLLHKGGIVFDRDMDSLQSEIYKIQCAFETPKSREDFTGMSLVTYDQRGSLSTITARGNREAIEQQIQLMNPLFMEVLPLTLEEIFITEMEGMGYDVQQLV